MAAEMVEKLPDECWGMIFCHLKYYSEMESVSLVCRRFLSITNSFRFNISIFNPSIKVLSSLLRRFPNIKKLRLVDFPGDLKLAVLEVAKSRLNLQELEISFTESLQKIGLEELGSKMKNLRVLKCKGCLGDADLVEIADSLPQLEELRVEFSYYYVKGNRMTFTDEGISYLSEKLQRLRKISLPHNEFITDESLVSLSSNCPFLEDIAVSYPGMTDTGISYVIHNSHHLISFMLSAHLKNGLLGAKRFTKFPKNLVSLIFIYADITDEFLLSITEAQIPLTQLVLICGESYTFSGISKLLHSYQSLRYLTLGEAAFLTNKHIERLIPFLHNLRSISLVCCPELSDPTFAILTQKCPHLSHIEMTKTGLGKEDCKYDDLLKNFAIKKLILSHNSHLSSSGLRRLFEICPNLEKIGFSNSFSRTDQLDMADILECNRGLLFLVLSCRIKFSSRYVEKSVLMALDLQYTETNDAALAILGNVCPDLVLLNLGCCDDITEEGVKEMVKSCKRLRFLSLNACNNVDIGIIPWIVMNSPCLRQLVSPSYTYPNEEEQKQFLQQGCLVRKSVN